MASDDQVVSRWRQPVTALSVDDTVEWATDALGRATLDYRARFSPDQIERFRLGYVCLECWEPHETPFPDNCLLCGYPMKAHQAEAFAEKFRGLERDPRSQLIEKELDKVDDTHERTWHETRIGIVVPSSPQGAKHGKT